MKRILAVCALAALIAGCRIQPEKTPASNTNENSAENNVVHRSFFMDRGFFDRAFDGEERSAIESQIVAGIIPHHLLASHLIARFFLGLQETAPSVVAVIGPNHFNNGSGPILSSLGEWSTPYGQLLPASEIIESLVNAGLVKIDERVFIKEHSISNEVSFIRRIFPQTYFLPIVLKNSVTVEDAKLLAERLNAELPDDALMIVSADFSHEVTPEIADQQAEKNIAVLSKRDSSLVADMYVDSKPSITVLLEYAKLRGAQNSLLLESSNAARASGEPGLTDVTSYLTMYFTK